MKRGFAIAIVYAVIVLIPIGLSALLVPPIVGEVEDVANNAPEYVQDVEDYVNKNETLQNLNDDYDITTKLQEEAQKLPERIPDAAGALSDIGVGFVNSIFAAVTILILSIFMVAGGPRWVTSSSRPSGPSTPSASSAPCAGSPTPSATTSAARCCRRRSRARSPSSC